MRRKPSKKDQVIPDPFFNSVLVAKFTNALMLKGKKSVATNIINQALALAEQQLKGKIQKEHEASVDFGFPPMSAPVPIQVQILMQALENVAPRVEVKNRRVGGASYKVPVEIRPTRRFGLAAKWLIDAARARSGKSMIQRLADELVQACRKEGAAIKKHVEMHRMAEANRMFAHLRY